MHALDLNASYIADLRFLHRRCETFYIVKYVTFINLCFFILPAVSKNKMK